MLKKILVAIEQSDISQYAFESALTMAKALAAELTIIHVLDIFDPASPRRSILPVDGYALHVNGKMQESYEHRWTNYVTQHDELLKQRQVDAEKAGVNAEILHSYGRPETVICNVARTIKADLIVVGSRGYQGLNEMLLGSVSNYVMHHAHCSVMVAHDRRVAVARAPEAPAQETSSQMDELAIAES